jgi:hypothetical protein
VTLIGNKTAEEQEGFSGGQGLKANIEIQKWMNVYTSRPVAGSVSDELEGSTGRVSGLRRLGATVKRYDSQQGGDSGVAATNRDGIICSSDCTFPPRPDYATLRTNNDIVRTYLPIYVS